MEYPTKNLDLEGEVTGRGHPSRPLYPHLKTQIFVQEFPPEFSENHVLYILTWICEFRLGNKTIWVVVDEESDFLGPRT